MYRIGGIFRGEKFSRISHFRKNYTQKTKFYMVHTLFLTIRENLTPRNIPPIRYAVRLLMSLEFIIMSVKINSVYMTQLLYHKNIHYLK